MPRFLPASHRLVCAVVANDNGQGYHAELADAVSEELAALGVNGTVLISGTTLELHAEGSPVSIDISAVQGQWPLLPAEMRKRKAEETARRLVQAHRAAAPFAARPRRNDDGDGELPKGRIIGAVVGIFGLLAAIGIARVYLPRMLAPKEEPKSTREPDTARMGRLARACEAGRDRVYKGTSIGPLSLEGWAVELWLGTKKGGTLKDHAALKAILADGKLAPGADEELAKVLDGTLEIKDGFDAETAKRSPAYTGAIVLFGEGYARAFLEPETRPRFLGLADRLFEATGAELGAMWARCAHQKTHDVGAWFRGPDTPGAVASMVFFMGLFAEQKIVDRAALAAIKADGGELDQLRKAAGDVSDSLPAIVGTQGGGLTMKGGATLVFGAGAPIRAVTAARDVAKKMGVAPAAGE
jgi:serine/threonine-protein kinase